MQTPIAILILAGAVVFASIPDWSRMLQHREDLGARAEAECRSLTSAFMRAEPLGYEESSVYEECLSHRVTGR